MPLAGNFSLPLSLPSATASRTAFSISRWALDAERLEKFPNAAVENVFVHDRLLCAIIHRNGADALRHTCRTGARRQNGASNVRAHSMMSLYALQKLIRDVNRRPHCREAYFQSPAKFADGYDLAGASATRCSSSTFARSTGWAFTACCCARSPSCTRSRNPITSRRSEESSDADHVCSRREPRAGHDGLGGGRAGGAEGSRVRRVREAAAGTRRERDRYADRAHLGALGQFLPRPHRRVLHRPRRDLQRAGGALAEDREGRDQGRSGARRPS